MRTKTLAPIAMILALLLAALPAAAGHRSHDGRDTKVAKLAHQLENATGRLYGNAVASRHERRWAPRRGFAALRSLDRQARRFHWQVERAGIHDRNTQHAFRRLEWAFSEAHYRLPALRARKALRRDFERVEKLMNKLDRRLVVAERRDEQQRHGRRDRARQARLAWFFGY